MSGDLYSHLMQGIAAERRGAHHAALRHYQDALSEAPDSALAHARLSLCLSDMNRRYGALAEAELALKLGPEEVIAHVAYGYASLLADDEAGVRRSIDRIRALDPNSEEGTWLECTVALRERRPGELRKAAEKLLSENPHRVDGKFFLSRAAALGGNGAEAERLAREALAVNPMAPAYHEAIGWSFYTQGKLDKARAAALSALSLAPRWQGAHHLLGSVQLRRHPLTGWFFRLGLWLIQLSTARQISLILIVLFLMNSVYEILRFMKVPYAREIDWGVSLLLAALFIVPGLALQRILKRELGEVRLTRDY